MSVRVSKWVQSCDFNDASTNSATTQIDMGGVLQDPLPDYAFMVVRIDKLLVDACHKLMKNEFVKMDDAPSR